MKYLSLIALAFVHTGCLDFGTTIIETTGSDPAAAPLVTSTVPENGAIAVPLSTPVTIGFSRPMLPDSVNLEVSPQLTLPTPTWNSEANEVTYPFTDLSVNTEYTVHITGTGTNSKTLDYVLTFHTANPTDNDPPTVAATFPADAAVGVATNSGIVVTFSEPMDISAPSTAVQVTPSGGAAIGCALQWQAANRQVVCTPVSALQPNKLHVVALAASLKDQAGNPLTTSSFSFTTGVGSDTTPPTITQVGFTPLAKNVDAVAHPANQDGIAINATLVFDFSETMSEVENGIVVSGTAKGSNTAMPIAGGFSPDPSNQNRWIFTPTSALPNAMVVSWHTTAELKDAAGVSAALISGIRSGRVIDRTSATFTAENSSSGYTSSSTATANEISLRTGKYSDDMVRSFLTFPTTDVQNRATSIVAARITLTQTYVSPADPYAGSEGVLIESVAYGSTLSKSDYNTDVLDYTGGGLGAILSYNLSRDANLEPKSVSVATMVTNDLLKRTDNPGGKVQVRMRFPLTFTSAASNSYVVLAGPQHNDSSKRPALLIDYEFKASASF